jgi:hypothetical protein
LVERSGFEQEDYPDARLLDSKLDLRFDAERRIALSELIVDGLYKYPIRWNKLPLRT